MSESRKSKFETESLQNLQRTGVIYTYFIEETAKVNIVMIWQKDDVSPILKKFLGVAQEIYCAYPHLSYKFL